MHYYALLRCEADVGRQARTSELLKRVTPAARRLRCQDEWPDFGLFGFADYFVEVLQMSPLLPSPLTYVSTTLYPSKLAKLVRSLGPRQR